MKHTILILFSALLLAACDDFFDVNPDSSLDVKIDSEEKIAELLTAAYPRASYYTFLEPRTDNVGERVKGEHNRLNEAMFFWEDYDQEDLDTPLNYWNACYKGIAQANTALELLASYEKTARVKALYGEAFLLRAYLHFMLVNIWSEPYGTNKSDVALGIPYLTKPEKYALVEYQRGTVKEVYDKIEADLKLGITLVDDRFYEHPKFHFNKKAAYAFASRFYLMKGEWNNVIEYADYVLGSNPKKLLRTWYKFVNDAHLRSNFTKLYNDVSEPSNLMFTTTESRITRNLPTEKYGSSMDYTKKWFDKKLIEGCSKSPNNLSHVLPFTRTGGAVVNGWYLAKCDEMDLSDGSGGVRPRNLFVTNVLFSVEEVMLNRIEAYAMTHAYDKAVDGIIDYIQTKYNVSLSCPRSAYTWTNSENYQLYTPFYGMTLKQLALVKTITEIRQREFLHEGLRWFDIRRFYLPVKRSSKSSWYRPLEKADERKLLQIPAEAINRGLKPNPRSFDVSGLPINPYRPRN